MTLPLRIMAVDDEPLALRRIEIALDHMENATLVATARDGAEALEKIAVERPDVLLLDIKMAGMTGFEVVEALDGDHVPLVIFVTAFDAFATRAFEVSAVDYVLKPVEFDRLRAALNKARERLEATDARQRAEELHLLVAALRSQSTDSTGSARYESEIWVQRRGEFVRLDTDEIDWIEADRDYVRVHAKGQSYLLRDTMHAFQERLDPSAFLRIRRSALVRIGSVAAVRPEGYGHVNVILTSGDEIRVGRTYAKSVRAFLSKPTPAAVRA
jgi:DNA-binding LytR/AlgR family response regulator